MIILALKNTKNILKHWKTAQNETRKRQQIVTYEHKIKGGVKTMVEVSFSPFLLQFLIIRSSKFQTAQRYTPSCYYFF